MSENDNLSRLFGGFDFGGWIIPLIVIFFILMLGEDLLDFIFCEEGLIWIIIIVMLIFFLGQDDGCGCF